MIRLPAVGSEVTAVAFSPAGPALAAGCRNGTVLYWANPLAGGPPQSAATADWRQMAVDTLAYEPSGEHLLVSLRKPGDMPCGSARFRLPDLTPDPGGWGNAVWNRLLPSPDGTLWATETTYRLTVRTGQPPYYEVWAPNTPHNVERFAFDPGSARLALLFRDAVTLVGDDEDAQPVDLIDRVQVFDARTGAVVCHGEDLFARHMYLSDPSHLAFSRAGRRFAHGHSRQVRVAETVSGRAVRVMDPPAGAEIAGAAFHPVTDELTVVLTDGSVVMMDFDTWAPTRRFDWQAGPLTALAFSPDGTLAAVAGDDGQVVMWDTG